MEKVKLISPWTGSYGSYPLHTDTVESRPSGPSGLGAVARMHSSASDESLNLMHTMPWAKSGEQHQSSADPWLVMLLLMYHFWKANLIYVHVCVLMCVYIYISVNVKRVNT